MRATNETLMEAASLGRGEQVRTICPACGGGSTKEASLLLSRDDDDCVRWYCFRASCHFTGGDKPRTISRVTKQHKARPWTGPLRVLRPAEWEYLTSKTGWYPTDHGMIGAPMYSEETDRYAFPIFGPTGRRRGWVLRSYAPTAQTKALTRMDVPEPHLSYYLTHPGKPAVIVEDIPSAVRAALYVNAVALNGTGCNDSYAQEIQSAVTSIRWALDADATQQALKLRKRYAALFDESGVILLDCDIKNMSEEQLQELLRRYGLV